VKVVNDHRRARFQSSIPAGRQATPGKDLIFRLHPRITPTDYTQGQVFAGRCVTPDLTLLKLRLARRDFVFWCSQHPGGGRAVRNTSFNAVVAGSNCARLTIILNRLERKAGVKRD
jgi:hypothetical protein